MDLRETTIQSRHLENERRVWLQHPEGDQPLDAYCILLDGEYYVQRMNAPAAVVGLWESPDLPRFGVAYVSHLNDAIRWPESFCNEAFASFVALELLPWVMDQSQASAEANPIVLGGLNLTGLAAAHAAIHHSDCFSAVLCQSASFWWSDDWLVERLQDQPRLPATFRITCGNRETDENVEHGEGLIQRTSQLASNRAVRDALRANGTHVLYDELDGGHDLASWDKDLPISLRLLLQ